MIPEAAMLRKEAQKNIAAITDNGCELRPAVTRFREANRSRLTCVVGDS